MEEEKKIPLYKWDHGWKAIMEEDKMENGIEEEVEEELMSVTIFCEKRCGHLKMVVAPNKTPHDLVPLDIMCNLHIKGYLPSSYGGSWGWSCSDELRSHISNAPYEPGIDVEFFNIDLEIGNWRIEGEEKALLSFHDDFWPVVIKKTEKTEIFSERKNRVEEFKKLFANFERGGEDIKQGGLIITPLRRKEYGDINWGEDYDATYKRGLHLYNHYIQGAQMAIRMDNGMLIRAGPETVVVSPDHLIDLVRLSPGNYFLHHPIPGGDGAD